MEQQPNCQKTLLSSREDFPTNIRVYRCLLAKLAAVISGAEEDAWMLELLCGECGKYHDSIRPY